LRKTASIIFPRIAVRALPQRFPSPPGGSATAVSARASHAADREHLERYRALHVQVALTLHRRAGRGECLPQWSSSSLSAERRRALKTQRLDTNASKASNY
jgi:hypothetical protein